MKIAYVLYPSFTALDLVGPYEVLSRWPEAEVHFVAASDAPVRADAGLVVAPTDTFDTLRDPGLVMVPGSSDALTPLTDEPLLDWVRAVTPGAEWMASACTGSTIYAAAGLLDGKRATTHWAFRDKLQELGANVVTDRVVFDEPFVSGAGVSAGIDMALALTARVHGEDLAKAIQLGIEYDPEPPFDAGSPEKADPALVEGMRAAFSSS